MRAVLCPREIGRNIRRDNEVTRPSSLTEVHPFFREWQARVLHTRVHAHARNWRRSRAILSWRNHEKEEEQGKRERDRQRKREKGDSCANGSLRIANGTLGSLGCESSAGKKGS